MAGILVFFSNDKFTWMQWPDCHQAKWRSHPGEHIAAWPSIVRPAPWVWPGPCIDRHSLPECDCQLVCGIVFGSGVMDCDWQLVVCAVLVCFGLIHCWRSGCDVAIWPWPTRMDPEHVRCWCLFLRHQKWYCHRCYSLLFFFVFVCCNFSFVW